MVKNKMEIKNKTIRATGWLLCIIGGVALGLSITLYPTMLLLGVPLMIVSYDFIFNEKYNDN